MNDDGALLLAIGRLEGKVDTLIQLQRIHEERLNAHDERLRLLEHSKSSIYGAASVVAIGLCLSVWLWEDSLRYSNRLFGHPWLSTHPPRAISLDFVNCCCQRS